MPRQPGWWNRASVAEPALARVVDWLACPHCGAGFTLVARSLRCEAGHSFDLARQGYVNLLGRAAPRNADTAEMVAARDRFLAGGWYEPIAAALRERLGSASRILEAGAGSAYYLSRALGGTAHGLATDVSAPASRRAARAHPRVAAVVADTWASLPVRDCVVDAVLCVFAPRNAAEFRRILVPGGRVVVVTPEPGHLQELRSRDGLLGIQADKAQELRSAFDGWEGHGAERLTYAVDLPAAAVADVVAMGPNAFHNSQAGGGLTTTVSVRLWEFSRRG